jgi:hypothetical protein
LILDALEITPEELPEPEIELVSQNPKVREVLDHARRAASMEFQERVEDLGSTAGIMEVSIYQEFSRLMNFHKIIG